MKVIAQALREYGAAIRGDWSELDGRSVRGQLDQFADAIETGDEADKPIEWWRAECGVCPDGGGHWSGSWAGHCETDDGCPSFRAG